jgi:predicted nucleic acid-binding protein
MKVPSAVLDTHVIVSALRSRAGASFGLLSLLPSGRFEPIISVPLMLEYEDACRRLLAPGSPLTAADVEVVLDMLCAASRHQRVFFLWRPLLRDPKDDMVLELAVAAGCDAIVTFNLRDFAGAERFGIRPVSPREFLDSLGTLP